MGKVIAHSGGEHVNFNELYEISVPEPTRSYCPVPHFDVLLTLEKMINGFYDNPAMTYDIVLARGGNQMFATFTFTENTATGLTIGVRNSYDKSLSLGLAAGAKVFICDNLAFSSEIVVMRKHTTMVQHWIDSRAPGVISAARRHYESWESDISFFATREITNDDGFKVLGLLYGHDILSPRQLTVAREQWDSPAHPEFQDRTLWSLYNSCTEALKSTPPQDMMIRQKLLHSMFTALPAAPIHF